MGTSMFVILAGCTPLRVQAQAVGIPEAAFDQLCSALVKSEGIRHSDRLYVLTQSRPIIDLMALNFAYRGEDAVSLEDVERADQLEEAYRRTFVQQVVKSEIGRINCRWRWGHRSFADYRGSRKYLVEMSNIMANPHVEHIAESHETHGFFVRFSLGGSMGAGWYWVAIAPQGDGWTVFRVVPLEVSDG